MTKVIAEAGSCHMAKKEYAKELIDLAVDTGCWAVKFQLFKNMPPNIELPREWWGELVDYAKGRIEIFASVFDGDAIDLLLKYKTRYIKISYSESGEYWWIHKLGEIPKLVISCPPERIKTYCDEDIKLFCIPEYPVLYKIDFREIFKRYPFDGFSDHTLGYWQTLKAINCGAEYIEKHITLDHDDIDCPDHRFALRPKELKEMMEKIKYL